MEVLNDEPFGLTSAEVVQALEQRNNPQIPASVRSTLSTAANNGELKYEDGRYMIADEKPIEQDARPSGLRPSGHLIEDHQPSVRQPSRDDDDEIPF